MNNTYKEIYNSFLSLRPGTRLVTNHTIFLKESKWFCEKTNLEKEYDD